MNGGTARGGALSDSGEPSTSGTIRGLGIRGSGVRVTAASNPYIHTPARAHITSGQRCDRCPPHRSCAPLTTSRARCVCSWAWGTQGPTPMLSQFTVVSGGGLLEARMAPRAGLTLKLKPTPSQLSLAPGGGLLGERWGAAQAWTLNPGPNALTFMSGGGLLEERVAPRAGLPPLLGPLADRAPEALQWLNPV